MRSGASMNPASPDLRPATRRLVSLKPEVRGDVPTEQALSHVPSVAPGSEPSWWLQEALAAEGNPERAKELFEGIGVDVAIVGGGYAGLGTALALRERAPALSIAVLEAEVCGAGASGKNGGFVHGYWRALPRLANTFGDGTALEIAQFGSRAQDALRAFCTGPGIDVWWRENGILKISCSPAQDASIERLLATTKRLGVMHQALPLSRAEVQRRCASPVYRDGVLLTEAANVQPARLVRALRASALSRGIRIFEQTEVLDVQPGSPATLVSRFGRVSAREVVLASNAALSSHPRLRSHLTNFSSYMVLTEPVPDRLRAIGWIGNEGIDDARMFLHYYRTTQDGRGAMGSGSGPIGLGGRPSLRYTKDAVTAARAEHGLRRLLPGLGGARIPPAWGGAIDVAADHLPFFGTFPRTRIHYGCGYSGHGVNPSYIGGQILASLVLDERNEWTQSIFCTRPVPALPPEPLRFIGGSLVRAAIIRCEEAEEETREPPLP